MAFELAAIDPTSVPINLLNPRPGTKFGDREYMDPWEAVKWIAIFRLILPDALFRLCGGRVENIGELQQLAVRAGINGVMMGNFLTTLGNTPDEDRAMFENLGLNVARQPDNAANPRPDNRSGWLEGDTPAAVRRPTPAPSSPAWRCACGIRPSSCASPENAMSPSAPTALRNATPSAAGAEARRRSRQVTEIQARLSELKGLGLYRRTRLVSGPQGPNVVLDGRPVLLLCSNNYLGLADHPRVQDAAAEAAMRWGVGAGRVAAGVGHDDRPQPPRAEARRVQGDRGRAAVRLGLSGEPRRRSARWRARATSSSPTSSTTPRSSTAAGCRAPRSSSTATTTWSTSRGGSRRPGRGRRSS